MIAIRFTRNRVWNPGDKLCLRIIDIRDNGKGRWVWEVEEISVNDMKLRFDDLYEMIESVGG